MLFAVGNGTNGMCGARTIGHSGWKKYGSGGLYIDFDTSMCIFSSKPQTFVSLQGDVPPMLSAFMSGTSSIADSTSKNTMRYTMQYPALASHALLAATKRGKWYIAWIAGNGSVI